MTLLPGRTCRVKCLQLLEIDLTTLMARNLHIQSDADACMPLNAPLLPREEEILNHINAALRIGALDRAIELLGELTKGRGMSRFAQKTGLNRSHLYRALQVGGNPSLDLVMRICEEMNLFIQVVRNSKEFQE